MVGGKGRWWGRERGSRWKRSKGMKERKEQVREWNRESQSEERKRGSRRMSERARSSFITSNTRQHMMKCLFFLT